MIRLAALILCLSIAGPVCAQATHSLKLLQGEDVGIIPRYLFLLLAMPAGWVALPAVQVPGQFAISINSYVAQSLNLDLPDEASLRRALQADGAPK